MRWSILVLVVICGVGADAAEPSCLRCHPGQREQFSASVHGRSGMACVDCHGGNAADFKDTAHKTADFRRAANKREVAELCAQCHSDVRKMNPYGLPTDQLDRYKTSKHGERLYGQGDADVAACTDCHGKHDILSAKSPQSRTHPANVPSTCGRCHSDEALMAKHKLPADPVEKYRTSYHAELLFKKGDASAPTCVTCHGNHGATPPGTVEVGQVCGKCHGRQRELFEKSPHAEAAKAGVFNECVSCHGNHAIQKASLDVFAQSCVQCHASDPKQLGVRDTMVGILRGAKDRLAAAGTVVRNATVRGLATDDEQLLLQEAQTQVTQLEALQHTLSPELLQPVAARAGELTGQTLADVAALERVELWKRKALWPVWVFLAGMALLFWLKRRQLEK